MTACNRSSNYSGFTSHYSSQYSLLMLTVCNLWCCCCTDAIVLHATAADIKYMFTSLCWCDTGMVCRIAYSAHFIRAYFSSAAPLLAALPRPQLAAALALAFLFTSMYLLIIYTIDIQYCSSRTPYDRQRAQLHCDDLMSAQRSTRHRLHRTTLDYTFSVQRLFIRLSLLHVVTKL
jgi:hypothetical protein